MGISFVCDSDVVLPCVTVNITINGSNPTCDYFVCSPVILKLSISFFARQSRLVSAVPSTLVQLILCVFSNVTNLRQDCKYINRHLVICLFLFVFFLVLLNKYSWAFLVRVTLSIVIHENYTPLIVHKFCFSSTGFPGFARVQICKFKFMCSC